MRVFYGYDLIASMFCSGLFWSISLLCETNSFYTLSSWGGDKLTYGSRKILLFYTAYYMLFTTKSACICFFLSINHLGLYGILFLIISRAKTPISPIIKRYLQLGIYPRTIFNTAANDPPKCHVPSIPILTLPRYFGGRNSSIAVKMAVN